MDGDRRLVQTLLERLSARVYLNSYLQLDTLASLRRELFN